MDVSTDVFDLDLDTNEHYQLQISCRDEVNSIKISSSTYFGARHGLETLFQLIYFDNFKLSFLLPCDVDISDGPYYKHRGVMLDTARYILFFILDKINVIKISLGISSLLTWSRPWLIPWATPRWMCSTGISQILKVFPFILILCLNLLSMGPTVLNRRIIRWNISHFHYKEIIIVCSGRWRK